MKRILLSAMSVVVFALSAAEIKTIEPAEGAVVPLLTDAQKAYLDMSSDLRREKFVDTKFRRKEMGHPAEQVPGEKKPREVYWPKTVRLAWEPVDGVDEYNVTVKDAKSGAIVIDQSVKGTSVNVDNLEIAAEYAWTVSGGGATGGGKFKTEDRAPRLVRFPGVPNVRDIGGWIGLDGRRVRQGLVFRSAGLNNNAAMAYYSVDELRKMGKDKEVKEAAEEAKKRLDQLLAWQADPKTMDLNDEEYVAWNKRYAGEPVAKFLSSRIHQAKKDVEAGGKSKVEKGMETGKSRVEGENGEYIRKRFGIKTDIDLRSDKECFGMTGSPLGPTVKWFHFSSDAYGGMQGSWGKEEFAKVFRVFLDEKNYPIDFHCIAGADRTGSVAYILCGLLGADEDHLARDWETTAFCSHGVDFCHEQRYDKLVNGFKKNFPADTVRERLEKYVLSLGFTEEDIAKFRGIMLEGAPTVKASRREVRPKIVGVWDHTGRGLHGGDWEKTMSALAEAGITDVFMDSRFHKGRILGDMIKACAAAGKAHGIRVHAWICCFQGAEREPTPKERRDAVAEAAEQIARDYEVDGIHLDYVRWSSKSKAERRPELITGFVEDVGRRVKKVRPGILLSAAVFPSYPSCRKDVGQDWHDWVDRGLLDYVLPMNYTADENKYVRYLNQQAKDAKRAAKTISGIGVTADGVTLDADAVRRQTALATERGMVGVCYFDLDKTFEEEIMPMLVRDRRTSLMQDVQRVDDSRFRDGCSTLEQNPARGDAHGGWHVLMEQGNEAGSPKGFCSWLWNIGQFSGGNEYKGKMPPSGCIGGRDKPISADALAAISNTLVNARANGAMLIVRFGYTSGAEEGTEPTDFNVLVGHVRQLAPILGAFPDVVHAVECGMTGPWGEMHSNNYREPHHIRAIGDAWLESLAKETALLVRYPKWVLDYSGKDVDEFMREVEDGTYYKVQPAQRRIGLFNDGYLGTEGDYGTWRNGKMWMNREQGVKYLEARRNMPYGGELAHIKEAEAEAVPLFDLSRYNIVQEFYRTHLSYLRNINGKRHVLAARIGRLVLTHDYDFEGMPDLSEWYGTDLRRFMLTHMGYRFVVRDVKFSTGFVSVDIENTGFGHLLCRCRAELVSGGSVMPVDLDLRKLAPCTRKVYTLPLPGKSAADVPLLLKVCLDTPAAQPILFANDAMREGDALRLR